MTARRSRLATWADWSAATDPGLTRLTSALRATLGVASGLAVEYLFALLTGQAPLVPMLLGAVLAMMATFAVTDPTRGQRAITMLCLPLFMIAGMVVALGVDRFRVASLAVFVVVMFVAVWMRRFGMRYFTGGMVLFLGYFFALFLGLRPAQLPGLLAVIGVAVGWSMLLTLVLLPIRNDRLLRRMLHAFEARARGVADAALDLLADPGEHRNQRRLRHRLTGLNETALLIDGQLGAPGAADAGVAETVRHAVFDGELAARALAGAVGQLVVLDQAPSDDSPDDLATGIEAVLGALRRDHWDAAEVTARDLETRTSPQATLSATVTAGAATRTGELLAHRVASAVRTLAEARRCWTGAPAAEGDPPRREAEFEAEFDAAVELVAGDLPGSAKTVSAMAERGEGLLAGMSLTTRQAIQVALATGLAVAVGDALSGQRYYWAVLAAFIAFTGTATVAETVTKAFNRSLGTMIGLLGAIPVVALTGVSVPVVLPIVLISIFCGFYLLRVSYALMIFFITLVVGELYALLGTFTAGLMFLRLEETVAGGAIGCAVALLVLPTRTHAAVAATRGDLLAALQTLLAELAGWLRDPDSPTALAGRARAVDVALHQMRLIARPLTLPGWLPSNERARQALLSYDGLAHHARRAARTARTAPPPGAALAAELARACDQLAILAAHLATPAPRLRHTSLSDTGDLLTALHMAAARDALAGGQAGGSLARELDHLHDTLVELAETHGFVTGAAAPTVTHGQPVPSGPALTPAVPPESEPTGAVHGRVHRPDYTAATAVVTLVDMSGRQRARTGTEAGDYQVVAPHPGPYLLICTPQPDESAAGAGPYACLLSVTGPAVTHDVVLPPVHAASSPVFPGCRTAGLSG